MNAAVCVAGTLLLALGASTVTVRANAQNLSPDHGDQSAKLECEKQLIVRVPFGFSAGSDGFPAGTYSLTNPSGGHLADGTGRIRITSGDNSIIGIVSTSSGHWDNSKHQSFLVFEKWRDDYTLRYIVTQGGVNAEIPKSKDDHFHEAKKEKPEEFVVVAVVE